MLKLDLVAIQIAIAAGMFWIEQGHRVVIDAPVADASPVAAAVCPDNDTVPYSAACLEFLNIPAEPAPRPQVVASFATPAPCPANDQVPYSPSCIAFLKGATETGMRWRAMADPVDALHLTPKPAAIARPRATGGCGWESLVGVLLGI